jgi:hypothetical protein
MALVGQLDADTMSHFNSWLQGERQAPAMSDAAAVQQ